MALRAGDVLGGARSVSTRELTDTSFGYVRNEATIAQEAAPDGVYVLRTRRPTVTLVAIEVTCGNGPLPVPIDAAVVTGVASRSVGQALSAARRRVCVRCDR